MGKGTHNVGSPDLSGDDSPQEVKEYLSSVALIDVSKLHELIVEEIDVKAVENHPLFNVYLTTVPAINTFVTGFEKTRLPRTNTNI